MERAYIFLSQEENAAKKLLPDLNINSLSDIFIVKSQRNFTEERGLFQVDFVHSRETISRGIVYASNSIVCVKHPARKWIPGLFLIPGLYQISLHLP